MASIVLVPVSFIASSLLLYMLSMNLPRLDDSSPVNSTALKFPANLEELGNLASLLTLYKETHFKYVLLLFSGAYLYKQTFAIPGSVFMNLLGGALFGLWYGFPLACVLTAAGATNCYMLSKFCGKDYIMKYFPDRIASFQQKIEENGDSLFFFLLFLRLFPISPNWFMNMVAPILNVPVHLFFFSVLIGLMPYNFICVHTGCFLSELSSINDIFNVWTWLKLLAMANIALIPGVFIKQYHEKQKQKNE
ncbi:hypothetical protein LSH36_366g01008 [Paralvinella palmiformis]|uniref:VTT domain-containing protein n=1 Tax=Paralvinella palmiformis TaxID=53620 RepID=A0AAD9JFG5_9ANNE|nr:hypothetical protein LSH36_366g01008 [Paralvinella palmiformis]